MPVLRTLVLFALAAVAETVVRGRSGKACAGAPGIAFIGAGIVALALYGFVATLQEDADSAGFRPTAAVLRFAGLPRRASPASQPDRYDLVGAAICLVGVGVIMSHSAQAFAADGDGSDEERAVP